MPEVNLGKVVGPKGSDGAQGPAGADGLSAYEQAQAGGYSGSELEFNQQLAGLSDGPFVPESDKGVASGVATLDSTGKLEETQKPDYTASEVGAVPTTRTVNGKAMSADVTLTGDDIPTSASDPTSISSQLSNKVNSVPIVIQPSVDVLTLETGHVYAVEGALSTKYNHPIDTSFNHLTYEVFGSSQSDEYGYKVIKCTSCYGQKWFRTQARNAWGEWIQDATATPPQEHEVSFRSGWSSSAAKSTYYKTQEGSCVVNCAVYGTGVASDNFIATLPAGFRPNATVCRAAHAYKGGIRGIADAQISANGDIVIYSPIEFDYVSFGATFLAQN